MKIIKQHLGPCGRNTSSSLALKAPPLIRLRSFRDQSIPCYRSLADIRCQLKSAKEREGRRDSAACWRCLLWTVEYLVNEITDTQYATPTDFSLVTARKLKNANLIE